MCCRWLGQYSSIEYSSPCFGCKRTWNGVAGGGGQTHGVGYDFVNRLIKDPTKLTILGNGEQSKPYVHVSDVVNAVTSLPLKQSQNFEVYNI